MLANIILPAQTHSHLLLDGFCVWGGTMARTSDGKCHLLFSLWPQKEGFEAWVLKSQIGYALADDPSGPYEFKRIIMQQRQGDYWDADVIHCPTMIEHQGKYYLYYMGNRGNGQWWDHRNNQRIGLAVADHPAGPWQRFDKPILDVSKDSWDCVMTSNPTCCKTPDGRFMLIYKAVSNKEAPPAYGPVLLGVAFSDSPLGPFIKHDKPILGNTDKGFMTEDPFVWHYGSKYYVVVKDMETFFSPHLRALVVFESDDGLNWQQCQNPLFLTRTIKYEDGTTQQYHRVERPQIYFEQGKPKTLFLAVKPTANSEESFNLHIPLDCNNSQL